MAKFDEGYINTADLTSSSISGLSNITTDLQNYYITDSSFSSHVSHDYGSLSAGSLEVNGRDVMQELDEVRDMLLLLKRDVDMEAKYPRLKELKEEYERALEKYKTFEVVKGERK